MPDFERIHEFVTFAQYLNVTKAAEALFISKSSLSKHIKQLEQDIGYSLVNHKGTKLNLTQEGEYFYNAFVEIVDIYTKASNKCKELQTFRRVTLVVQNPSYSDKTAQQLYSLVSELQADGYNLIVNYCHPQRRNLVEELESERIDIILLHRVTALNGTVEQSEFDDRGIITKHLCEDSLAVWCHKSHDLARHEQISLDDFRSVTVITPNDIYAPLREIFTYYCNEANVKPNFMIVSSEEPSTFLSLRYPESVYVVPSSAEMDVRIQARKDMVLMPIENGELIFHSYCAMLDRRVEELVGIGIDIVMERTQYL